MQATRSVEGGRRRAACVGYIQSVLTVSRNEYKYVAEIETDLADLPLVSCHIVKLGQVFLNLVVNAGHATEATSAVDNGQCGTIRICSSTEDDIVLIAVTGTGTGIPAEINERSSTRVRLDEHTPP